MGGMHDDAPAMEYEALLGLARALLFPLGYRKNGNTFGRAAGVSTQVINFQRSQWRVDRTGPVSFTINLGVYLHRENDAPRHKLEYECHWRLRIGHLMPDDRDTWWEVGGSAATEQVWAEIQSVLVERALPMLDQPKTLEGVRKLFLDWAPVYGISGEEWLEEILGR